jgi:hypothetical protein
LSAAYSKNHLFGSVFEIRRGQNSRGFVQACAPQGTKLLDGPGNRTTARTTVTLSKSISRQRAQVSTTGQPSIGSNAWHTFQAKTGNRGSTDSRAQLDGPIALAPLAWPHWLASSLHRCDSSCFQDQGYVNRLAQAKLGIPVRCVSLLAR